MESSETNFFQNLPSLTRALPFFQSTYSNQQLPLDQKRLRNSHKLNWNYYFIDSKLESKSESDPPKPSVIYFFHWLWTIHLYFSKST